jgi:hypothetical protein
MPKMTHKTTESEQEAVADLVATFLAYMGEHGTDRARGAILGMVQLVVMAEREGEMPVMVTLQ